MDAKITVAAALDRIGPDHTDLLRHHADIGLLAPVIGEAVVAQSVFQMTQQHDVVLERDIRTASAATTAESAATAAAKTAATSAAESATATAVECRAMSATCNASASAVTDAGA